MNLSILKKDKANLHCEKLFKMCMNKSLALNFVGNCVGVVAFRIRHVSSKGT